MGTKESVKRFDRHFLRVYAQSLVVVTSLFVTIFLVVDVLLNADKIANFSDPVAGTLKFYSFNLPPLLYLLFPLVVLASGLFTLGRVLKARELLVLEAAGVGKKRALASVLIATLLLSLGGLALRQFALPPLADAARESPYGAFEFRKGKRITVRDDDGNMWFVRRYNLDERSLTDVRILEAGGKRVYVADELRWDDTRRGWWAGQGGTVHNLDALFDEDAIDSQRVKGAPAFGNLPPADFARRRRGFGGYSLTELIDHAATTGNREARVSFWHELWHPFSGLVLLFSGCGLLLSSRFKIFVAGGLVLACVVGYQILLFWFETLAQSGAFAPILGTTITPVLFAILGAALFWRV